MSAFNLIGGQFANTSLNNITESGKQVIRIVAGEIPGGGEVDSVCGIGPNGANDVPLKLLNLYDVNNNPIASNGSVMYYNANDQQYHYNTIPFLEGDLPSTIIGYDTDLKLITKSLGRTLAGSYTIPGSKGILASNGNNGTVLFLATNNNDEILVSDNTQPFGFGYRSIKNINSIGKENAYINISYISPGYPLNGFDASPGDIVNFDNILDSAQLQVDFGGISSIFTNPYSATIGFNNAYMTAGVNYFFNISFTMGLTITGNTLGALLRNLVMIVENPNTPQQVLYTQTAVECTTVTINNYLQITSNPVTLSVDSTRASNTYSVCLVCLSSAPSLSFILSNVSYSAWLI